MKYMNSEKRLVLSEPLLTYHTLSIVHKDHKRSPYTS